MNRAQIGFLTMIGSVLCGSFLFGFIGALLGLLVWLLIVTWLAISE